MADDYTLKDDNRRNIRYTDNHSVVDVLPQHFVEQYPKLVALLQYYYEHEDSEDSPARLIHDIIINKDITAVDQSLLSYIEDELLLGQSYFEGFQNKRAAAQYSNTLYRSKGTLYSIQQFFRTFFGTTPDVRYTKEDRIIVGESLIGYESQRYITDDKLYQTYAIQIKADIPISEWRDAYKLFVHPAGMYIGGEVQLVGSTSLALDAMPDYVKPLNLNPVVSGTASMGMVAYDDVTGIVQYLDSADDLRIDLPTTIETYQNLELGVIDRYYDGVRELIGTNSPTFDEDSAGTDYHVARFDMNESLFDTFDEVKYVWYSADSA